MMKFSTLFAFAFIMLTMVGCGSDDDSSDESSWTQDPDFTVANLNYKVEDFKNLKSDTAN